MSKLQLTRGAVVALLAWLATMLLVFWLLIIARTNIINTLSTPEAQADWQRWQQEETARQADPKAPARRRAPKSPQPPALVLMRDNFPAVAAALLVVVTICFLFGAMTLRGLFKNGEQSSQA
jgi:hypothetical protein